MTHSLVNALLWIVGSMLLVSGSAHLLLKTYVKGRHQPSHKESLPVVKAIIQTGPQKEALKTAYLAELMHLSQDRPLASTAFNAEEAKKRLLESPLIQSADVKLVSSDTVYVDYTVRQPIAWLSDIDNAAIDKEGHLFPVKPFFTPKKLPEVYLGLRARGVEKISWNSSLYDRHLELALRILELLTESVYRDFFSLKRIDVSNAFASSYGRREIVVRTEDQIIRGARGQEVTYYLPCLLRLTPKDYSQELGNYLKLREKMLEEELQKIERLGADSRQEVRLPEKSIDLRIENLAFIDENR